MLRVEEGRFIIFKIINLLGKKKEKRRRRRGDLFKSFAFFLGLLNDIDLRQTL